MSPTVPLIPIDLGGQKPYAEPLSKLPVKLPRDIYAYYAQRVLGDHIEHKIPKEQTPSIPIVTADTPEDAKAATAEDKKRRIPFGPGPVIPQAPVAILGAGVGGLYAGMMLASVGVPFEILEASGRTGGRLFTYQFYNGESHDYFDIGAMRFPDAEQNPSMKRLFQLFHSHQLNPKDGPKLAEKLLDYKFTCDDTFRIYNGVRTKVKNPDNNTYRFEETGVSTATIDIGAGNILKEQILDTFVKPLLDDLHTGGRKGWDLLMKYDNFTTRSYLTLVKNIDAVTVDWIETVTYGTGWFDRALAEYVLEAIAFSEFVENPRYKCIDGGSRTLSDFMTRYINQQCPGALQLGKRVTQLVYNAPEEGDFWARPLQVRVEGEAQPRSYPHVISTLPLPVLRSLDIDDAGLEVKQTNALRLLQYGPSEKIGVKFRTQWWRYGKQKNGQPLNIIGGQSYSDRCVRTVVYPSYGVLPENAPETTVLIASYSWTEDALRLGAMISAGGEQKPQVKELVLRDLAKIHNVTYEYLLDQYEDHFGWDWTHDPLTQGAFAFFGPGEFSTVYRSLTRPAPHGRLHFAGEALSTRHAWVVGALDSAWRAVKEVLWCSYPYLIPQFELLWGNNEEWIIPEPLKDYEKEVPKVSLPEAEGTFQVQAAAAVLGQSEEGPKPTTDLLFLQLATHLPKDFPLGYLAVNDLKDA